jgi:hypothetical protein
MFFGGHSRRELSPHSEMVKKIFGHPEVASSSRANRSRCTSRDTTRTVKLGRDASTPRRKRVSFWKPTLRQTCSWEDPGAPFAFKDSMIH